MRIGAPRSHLRRHPDRFHELFRRSTSAERGLRVPLDAIRALRDVRDRNGEDLLHFGRKRTLGENRLPKCLERRLLVRGQVAPSAGDWMETRGGVTIEVTFWSLHPSSSKIGRVRRMRVLRRWVRG